jgi:hypothetical protein
MQIVRRAQCTLVNLSVCDADQGPRGERLAASSSASLLPRLSATWLPPTNVHIAKIPTDRPNWTPAAALDQVPVTSHFAADQCPGTKTSLPRASLLTFSFLVCGADLSRREEVFGTRQNALEGSAVGSPEPATGNADSKRPVSIGSTTHFGAARRVSSRHVISLILPSARISRNWSLVKKS